jgi:nitronate monooxygenase
MGPLPLFGLLPDVVRAADGRPVLAAGGIVDGHGLAAVLCLGAAGVLMGTRFLATPEAPASAGHKQGIVAAEGPDSTAASGIFDILWGMSWPGVQARALRNELTGRWLGREDELRAHLPEVREQLAQAEATEDPAMSVLLAGMGVGRIAAVVPAAEVVRDVVSEATRFLQDWGSRVQKDEPRNVGFLAE